MRRSRLFWGLALVVLGGLLLLRSLGIITWNVWLIFWPAILILAGAWMLLGPSVVKDEQKTDSLAIPLESAQEAVVDINHGAGTLKIGAGAKATNLVEGTFVGGVEQRIDYSSDWASLTLSAPSNVIFGFPGTFGPEGLRWDVRFNDRIPMDLRLHTGAGESRLDLSSLLVQKLSLETGASSTVITLPARAGMTDVEVRAGAASVVMRIPQGVAARIFMKSGLVSTKIDTNRFPYNGSVYETPGYETSQNKVEIVVEAGVGSIEILSA